MSRDDESPKYELNMTDYDEGGAGGIAGRAVGWLLGARYISQIYLLNILGHARICVSYISVRSRVTNEARVVFRRPLIEEFQGSKMNSI